MVLVTWVKNNPCNQYHLEGHLLPSVESEKDLGVWISNDWNFREHILTSIGKANANIAWVARTVISRSPQVMTQIYKTLIRPHLEYCVQLWSPLPKHGNWGLILDIENVQRSFTRMIDGIGLLTYEERLNKLDLTTLLERRARGDLIETFKILSGIADYGEKFFSLSRSGNNLVSRPGDEKSTKHSFFSRRVIPYWNKLPSDVKLSKSVNDFKNKLDRFRENNVASGTSGNFWDLSIEIFSRIPSDNRKQYVDYMINNPQVAKCKFINVK